MYKLCKIILIAHNQEIKSEDHKICKTNFEGGENLWHIIVDINMKQAQKNYNQNMNKYKKNIQRKVLQERQM